MSLKDNYEPNKCEWCGDFMIFHRKKKYCNNSCRAYAWRHKKNKIPHKKNTTPTQTTKKMIPTYKEMSYLKRRRDVDDFPGYLDLIKRFNKFLSEHKQYYFDGKLLYVLEKTHEILTEYDPNINADLIEKYLNIIDNSA